MLARRWELAQAEREALIRLARRKGLSQADAEDCAQEAIVSVVPRPDLDEARIGGLLATVVKRRAIDMHRRSRTAARACERLKVVANGDIEAPDEALCDRAEAEWSATIIGGLPSQQRRMLAARAEGRSWSEIADELSTTVKAVESAMSRARATVRYAIASTLGLWLALVRRVRSTAPAVTAGGTAAAIVLAAFTVPLLRHALSPDEPGARDGGANPSIHLAAATSAGTRIAPATAAATANHRGDGHHAGDHGDKSDDSGASPVAYRAEVTVPVQEAPRHHVWVRTEEQDQDHVTYVTQCLSRYKVTLTPNGPGGLPDVDANCDEPQDH